MGNLTKEQLKEYLRNKWNLPFDRIVKDLDVTKSGVENLKKLLAQLIYEDWIEESQCLEHNRVEYDPGNAQLEKKKPAQEIDWSRGVN